MIDAELQDYVDKQVAQLRRELVTLMSSQPRQLPPVLLTRERAESIWLEAIPAWSAEETGYVEGDVVRHADAVWVALPDVTTGMAPDDVYDLLSRTGGWARYEY